MSDRQQLAVLRSVRPAFSWRSRLDGVFFELRVVYNSRRHKWTIDVRDSEGTALVLGLPLLVGISLLEPWRGLIGFPPGQLFADDTTDNDRDPERNDLRGVVRLIYRPAADVATLAGTALEVR